MFVCFEGVFILQVFDILLRDGSLWPLKLLKYYRSLRILLFMVLSGVIVDSMYLNSESVFWLFKPLKKYKQPNNDKINHLTKPINRNICHHKNSCNSHILQV